MQYGSLIGIFDSLTLTPEHPFSPEGSLFTYSPLKSPESLHYHNFLELGYCESGCGIFLVDGQAIPFSGRCCSVIYGGQVHIAQSVNDEKSVWHFLYLSTDALLHGSEALLSGQFRAMAPHLYSFPSVIPEAQDPEMYQLCRMIMDETARMQDNVIPCVRGLTIALLALHSRYMTPLDKPRRNSRQQIEKLQPVLQFINRHYAEDISVEQLVSVSHMSKSTLQRAWNDFTGMSPARYLHHLRMQRATAMLSGRGVRISDVAFSVGYVSLSTFNRRFQAEYGMSPTEWLRHRTEPDGPD